MKSLSTNHATQRCPFIPVSLKLLQCYIESKLRTFHMACGSTTHFRKSSRFTTAVRADQVVKNMPKVISDPLIYSVLENDAPDDFKNGQYLRFWPHLKMRGTCVRWPAGPPGGGGALRAAKAHPDSTRQESREIISASSVLACRRPISSYSLPQLTAEIIYNPIPGHDMAL